MGIKTNHSTQIKFGAILSYITILVEVVISLVFTPWMIGVLGKGDYAVYTIVYSLISLFLFDFGISMSATKFLSKYRAENKEDMVNNLMSMFFKLYIIIDVIVFTALLVMYFFIEKIYVGLTPEAVVQLKNAYLVVGFYSLISFPFINLDSLFAAKEKFIPLKLCVLFQKIITTVVMLIFLLNGYKVFTMILINACVGLATILVKAILAKTICKFKFSIKFFDKSMLITVFAFSFWIAIISLRDKLINGLTPTILGIVSNEAEVAYYGYGFTIITYAYTFASAISTLFVYRVTDILKQKGGNKKLFNLMVKIGKIQLFIIALIFCGFIVFGKPFLALFVGTDYVNSYLAAIFLLIPFLFSITKQIALTASYVTDNVRPLAICNLGTAVVCVGLSFVFGKMWGALGVSICYCVCCLTCELLCDIFVYYRKMKLNMVNFYIKTIGKIVVPSTLLTVVGVLVVNNFFAIDSKLKLAIGVVAFALVYCISCWFLFLSKKEQKMLLRRKQNAMYKPNDLSNKEVINIVWVTQRFDQSVAPICDQLASDKRCNLKVVLFDADVTKNNYRVDYERDYVFADCNNSPEEIDKILTECDVIMLGQALFKKVKKYAKQGKLIFRISEPLYKNSRSVLRAPLDYIRYIYRHKIYQRYNVFYLAIGNDGYDDLLRFDNFYEGRSYVWGYYPLSETQLPSLNKEKHTDEVSILWSGKFMKLKHPTVAVEATKYLVDKGIKCKTTIIGSGEEQEHIDTLIKKYNLDEYVTVKGPVTHYELLEVMQNTSVYMFTSDSKEGWGMVLNEALSNGCACISSSTAGASKPMIINGNNGLLYSNEEELHRCLDQIIDPQFRVVLGENGYSLYKEQYTTEALSTRLIELTKQVSTGKFDSQYQQGPCSNCESLWER